MSLLDDLRAKKAVITTLCHHYGAFNVRVFGSVARREERPDSDVDILVSCPDLMERPDDLHVLMQLTMLHAGLEALLRRKVDLTPEHLLLPHNRARVFGGAVEL